MSDLIETAISRILAKLAKVRKGCYRSFGSEAHSFKLNPPISEDTVELFEKEHAVRLPEDYRRFLTAAGNGGAGPYYGILPLERWDAAMHTSDPARIARPSPLWPGMEPGRAWDEAFGCAWEELFQGSISLIQQGCSYHGLLVVTGQYRGHVVYVDVEGSGEPYFVAHPDFLSWYERCLNELLAGWDTAAFGYGHPGTVVELKHIIANTTDASLRAEALRSLQRVPK